MMPPRLMKEARKLYLWYADGSAPPAGSICRGTPPPYSCTFGASLEECKAKVQVWLDRWYAGFDVEFTTAKPTGGPHHVVVVTSSGDWCDQDPSVAGIAPFRCGGLEGATAYALTCGDDAKACAVIIAQEQGHLMGLEHTENPNDVMNAEVCSDCDGFANRPSAVMAGRCGRNTQNSHGMVMQRLGGRISDSP